MQLLQQGHTEAQQLSPRQSRTRLARLCRGLLINICSFPGWPIFIPLCHLPISLPTVLPPEGRFPDLPNLGSHKASRHLPAAFPRGCQFPAAQQHAHPQPSRLSWCHHSLPAAALIPPDRSLGQEDGDRAAFGGREPLVCQEATRSHWGSTWSYRLLLEGWTILCCAWFCFRWPTAAVQGVSLHSTSRLDQIHHFLRPPELRFFLGIPHIWVWAPLLHSCRWPWQQTAPLCKRWLCAASVTVAASSSCTAPLSRHRSSSRSWLCSPFPKLPSAAELHQAPPPAHIWLKTWPKQRPRKGCIHLTAKSTWRAQTPRNQQVHFFILLLKSLP